MDLKLKIFQGKNAGQEVPITGSKFLIGRAEDCQLRPGSEMISRHHCVIVVDQTYVAVRDFGSKNGTYVNAERVVGERELKSGDQLRIGPLEFEISMRQGELGGKKKPPVHNTKQAAERTAAGHPDEVDVAHWLGDPGLEGPGLGVSRSEERSPAASRQSDPGLDDPASQAPPAADPRVTTSDTQSIRMGDTEHIAIARPVAAWTESAAAVPRVAPPVPVPVQPTPRPEPQQPPTVAANPAPVSPNVAAGQAANATAMPPADLPKRPLPSIFQMPEPEAPAPAAEDKTGRLDKKKVFGKLPPRQPDATNTRSAAADLLDKMRTRR